MTITPKTIFLALAVSFLFLFAWTSRSPVPKSVSPTQLTPTAAAYETKKSEAANVTVMVTPITLKPGFSASFDVAFETHSVELEFDVPQIATLTDNQGSFGIPTWNGSPPGGHHRSGTLTFPTPLGKASTVSLIFKGIARVPMRTFEWNVY